MTDEKQSMDRIMKAHARIVAVIVKESAALNLPEEGALASMLISGAVGQMVSSFIRLGKERKYDLETFSGFVNGGVDQVERCVENGLDKAGLPSICEIDGIPEESDA